VARQKRIIMARRVNKKFIIRLAIVGIALLVVGLLGGWYKFVYTKNPFPHVKAGDEFMQQGRYEDAVESYARAIRLKDIDLNVWIKLGDAQNHLAREDVSNLFKARNIWEASLGQNPNFLPAHQRLLKQFRDIADASPGSARVQWLERAGNSAKNILRIDPENKEAKFVAQQVIVESWLAGQQVNDPLKINETIDALRAIQTEQPDEAEVPYTMARAMAQQGFEAYRRGEKQETSRLWDEAHAIMKAAAEAHPQDGRFLLRQAQLMIGIGPRMDRLADRDEAQARALNKELTEAAGEIAMKAGELLKPEHDDYTEELLSAATMLQRAGRIPDAEKLLAAGVAAKPDELSLRIALVDVIRSDSKRLNEAIDLLAKAPPPARVRPGIDGQVYKDAEARANIILADLTLDQYMAMRESASPEASSKLMIEAQDLLSKAKDQESARTLRIRGKMELFRGDAVSAVQTLRRALDIATDPNDRTRFEVMYLLARAFLITEQTGEAERLFREISDRLDYYPARTELVKLLLRKGALAEAEKYLLPLEQSNPETVDVIGLRMAYEELANKDRTPEQVKKNLDRLPENTLPRLAYKAQVAFAAKQYAEAVRISELVLKQKPDDRRAALVIAQCYEVMGDKPKAVAFLDDYLKGFPESPTVKMAVERLRGATMDQLRTLGLKEIEAIADPLQKNLVLVEFYGQTGDEKGMAAALAEAVKLAPDNPRVVEASFQQAVRSGDDAAAEKLLEQIAKLNIDGAEGRSAKAKLLTIQASRELDPRKRAEKLQVAIDAAVDLTQARGEFDSVWAVLGQAYQMAGRIDDAITAYQQAINRKPQNREALEGLIRCYYQKRSAPDIKNFIDQALAIYPRNRLFLDFKVSWDVEFGNPLDALPQREEDLKNNPEQAVVYGNLAAIYNTAAMKATDEAEKKKLREKAWGYFKQGVEKFPNSLELVSYFAEVSQELGKFSDGEQAWLKLAADPKLSKSPIVAQRIAAYYRRNGKVAESRKYLTEFVAANESPGVRVALADIALLEKQPGEAQKQLELAGDDPLALRRRTDLLLADGKGDEAETLVQKALESRPTDLTLLNRQAFVLMSRGKLDAADAVLKKILGISAQDSQALFFTAMLEAQAGKIDEAMQRINRLRDLEPDNIDVRKLAAELFRQQNNVAMATSELEMALRMDPEDKTTRIQLIEAYITPTPPRLADAERLIKEAKKLPAVASDISFQHVAARYFYAKGDYAQALEELKGPIKERPTDLALQDTYFRTMMAAKQYDTVIKTSTSLLELVKQPWIYSTRGSAYARLKQVEKSMADFEAGYQLATEASDDFSQQNIIRAMFGEIGTEPAIAFLIPRSQGNDLLKIFLAQIYTLTSKYDKAHALVAEVFPRRDKLPQKQRESFLKLTGAVGLSLVPPDLVLSRQAYDEYLVIRPADYQAINNVACLLMMPGSGAKPGEAVAYAQRAVDQMAKVNRKEPLVLDTLGTAYLDDGKIDEAIIIIREALLIEEFADGFVHLADGLVRKGELTDASSALDKAQLMIENDKTAKRVPPGGFEKLEKQIGELRLKTMAAQQPPPAPPTGSNGGN